MLYAKVVLGIPVEGPFDYIVPDNFSQKIKVGCRVWVNLRTKKALGYVVGLTRKTNIKNLKPVLDLIDDAPILDRNMLLLTRKLSDYYCCAWGEAIETALPDSLRKGKRIPLIKKTEYPRQKYNPEVTLIHSFEERKKWDIYLKSIKETLKDNRSVIVLFPDVNSVLRAKEIIAADLGISPAFLYRKQPQELEWWLKIKRGEFNIVVGTRSSVFAPLNNLGLIIIDEEQDSVYKQDQVPHYHAREVVLMRINIEKAKLILGSICPSLETFYLAKKNKINPSTTLRIDAERSRSVKYILIPRTGDFPEVKIIDMKFDYQFKKQRNALLSKYLEDAIVLSLNSGGKVLLFLNRKGFATFASCLHCGIALKCPRCNINLVYHFKENILNCHYCNFKMPVPTICPHCNAGYIKFSGMGTEKIESELSRLFPQAKIKRFDHDSRLDTQDADIFVATSLIVKQADCKFDLIGVLSIDNSLNRVDLRASEKTFALLVGLLGLTKENIVIQTNLPRHYCLEALAKKDINMFYDEELRQRRQLNFPPYKHIILVKLRGKIEERVRETSFSLFKRLSKYNKDKGIQIVSINAGQPSKLRGNFYWQILISSRDVKKVSAFLKINLKDFLHSGIIVTVDVDPL